MTSSEIINKYPELFGEPPFDPKETLICFGFEVSEAWLPILEKGFQEMAEVIKESGQKDFRVRQVKEKFASLRVYTNYTTDEVEAVIEKMEDECSHTCEKCGSPEGKLRQDGWLAIICDKCYEQEAKEKADAN
jgi:hypothetical protein